MKSLVDICLVLYEEDLLGENIYVSETRPRKRRKLWRPRLGKCQSAYLRGKTESKTAEAGLFVSFFMSVDAHKMKWSLSCFGLIIQTNGCNNLSQSQVNNAV